MLGKKKRLARIECKIEYNLAKAKKAQIMGMSFQFIFSVILIAIFIFTAIYAIRIFLNRAEHIRIVNSEQEFVSAVNRLWTETEAIQDFTFDLPSSIKYLCFSADFANTQSENFPKGVYWEISKYKDKKADLFFYPPKVMLGHQLSPHLKVLCGTKKIPCLNLSNLAEQEPSADPYCVPNKNGVTITLVKEFGSADVEIMPKT